MLSYCKDVQILTTFDLIPSVIFEYIKCLLPKKSTILSMVAVYHPSIIDYTITR